MPTLIYSMSVSLDGHIAGPDGAIDWAAPDEELMLFHNEQTRELTGHLTGRRPSRPGRIPRPLSSPGSGRPSRKWCSRPA